MPRLVGVLASLLLLVAAATVSLLAPATLAQVPVPASPDDPLEGWRLGGSIQAHRDDYRDFRCAPSVVAPDLTFCRRIRFARDRHGSYDVMYSFLHTRAGTLVYVDRYQRPAFFDELAARRVIDHVSSLRGEPAHLSTMPQRPGLPDAILAVWGATELEPLVEARVAAIAKGQIQGTEFLVDYLVDVVRSARERLPIYRFGGGAGFVWLAGLDPRGQGFLRMTAVDVSAIAKSR